MKYLLISLAAGLLSLIVAGIFAVLIMRKPTGDDKMRKIAAAISEGANAYMLRQFTVIAVFTIIIFLILGFCLNFYMAIGFLVGAILSALAGLIGMQISVRANVRTAEAARNGLKKALSLAFKGGSVTGLSVVGLAILGIAGIFLTYQNFGLETIKIPQQLMGFAFGASLISLFARVGGGIFTKAADVGADLVGKVEAGIPEDDPRNPAVIADNVGDNVGDCAGMGADLFETYAVTLIAAMMLAGILGLGESMIFYPLMLGSVAIVSSIIGVFFVRLGKSEKIMAALYKGVIATAILSLIGFWGVTKYFSVSMNLFWAGVIGVVVTALIIVITEYYTSKNFNPVREVAKASETGAGTNIIIGLAKGLESTFPIVIVLGAAILGAYWLGGLYGIAVSAVAMLSTTGIVIAMDSYGPITDNAGGIAEMAGLSDSIRKNTDALDAVGNTTKAVTKGYAIGSAALAALILFQDYTHALGQTQSVVFDIANPKVLVGLMIGALLPFLFSSFCMKAVGKAAHNVVEEVRRQFREIKGIMEGTGKPEYGTCVKIVTNAALRQMIVPAVIAVIAPLLVGFILGPLALGGLLIGVIICGLLVAVQMANGGATWDNAKKYIEDGNFGGKGSAAHKAAVVGDTVGDPYKDTAGPAINALIKVINTISVIIAPLLAMMFLS
ncbi:MAG: sodium-translocating pyrophosphatase [Patescibacteria group bacterium]|nr:sodium-translocating pyrophosphatase [Patescibacteria group bacterium]